MKMKNFIIILLVVLVTPLYPKSLKERSFSPGIEAKLGRPQPDKKVQNVGRVWSALGNQGTYGDATSVLPTYDWPGGTGVYYLWEGRLWIGAIINGIYYCSHADYGNYEFYPSEDGDWRIKRPGVSMFDIECKYDDWYDAANQPSRQLGIKVIQRALQWSVEGFNDFIAYEYKVLYNKEESFHQKEEFEFYIAWIFDADVGGRVSTDDYIDDLVHYDGWTNGEWSRAYYPPDDESIDYPYDKITLLPDGTIKEEPDGVLDQICIFGDEPEERTVNGDTLYIWRNLSYIYDDENPRIPGDDRREEGKVPGYIAGIVVYAPPSPNDSIWIGPNGDTCRMIRPMSHQWWNWANDPPGDEDKMLYMLGKHPFSEDKRFMPHPFDIGGPTFDYRFMHTYGPYKITPKDTLEFVFVGIVGFGLNGGEAYGEGVTQGIFQGGKWYPGIRWVADQAIKAYYMGSQHSDPIHPSAPSEDIHWLIPIPPEVPSLMYSAGLGKVTLVWDDIAEQTPDPIDNVYDFVGYRVYRCEFKIGGWKLLKGFVDEEFGKSQGFSEDMYEFIKKGAVFPHTYVDTTPIPGVPYFYSVVAFDRGRESPPAPIKIRSLESGKTNYKKTELGAEIPVFVKTERQKDEEIDLDKVVVVPNPYIASACWERKYENKIQFMNLPGRCRIFIYTVSGDLVKEFEHKDGTGDVYWDLLSRNEQEVVSGLYIYKVEAEEVKKDGTKIMKSKVGKFVIIR
jgi:hypothetical protein